MRLQCMEDYIFAGKRLGRSRQAIRLGVQKISGITICDTSENRMYDPLPDVETSRSTARQPVAAGSTTTGCPWFVNVVNFLHSGDRGCDGSSSHLCREGLSENPKGRRTV
ncbi:hypothetical protein KSP40_PGU013400 [Platanthera guangdongensis]|uniref:Uncharacterized protein n=1 Tax=Platanthera guangdongensis TaxID=2320717 RepID=A0ABR2MM62_9ASPA